MQKVKRLNMQTEPPRSIVRGKGSGAAIQEMIGRVAKTRIQPMVLHSYDATVGNYAFWDKFRRAEAVGYQIAGAFARPIAKTLASWMFGVGAARVLLADQVADDDPLKDSVDYTNGLLADFVGTVQADLLTLVEDMYSLGDQYLIINADGTISIPSPETVTEERDPLDYRTVVAYTITTELEKATVKDRYTATERTVTIKYKSESGRAEIFTYDNLIGTVPVIHWANDRGTNETHGRPVYGPLLRIFSRYDDLIEKMIDGSELMGNPIPTMEGLEDPEETITLNGSRANDDYVDTDGGAYPRYTIRFDALSTLLIGKGGSFKFATPPVGFTNDSRATLKSLFLLIMEYTRIPEAFWGNELSSARATAEEQIKTFIKYIESERLAFQGADVVSPNRGGLLRMADVWLRFKALTDRRVRLAPLRVEWAELSEADAQIVREWAALLHDRDVITDETLVGLSGMVDDPAAEVDRARAEAEAERDLFERNMDAMLAVQAEPEPEA